MPIVDTASDVVEVVATGDDATAILPADIAPANGTPKTNPDKAQLRQLFMFAERPERTMFITGLIFTALGGICWPIPFILMGDSFAGANVGRLGYINQIVWQLCAVGGAIMLFKYVAVVCIDCSKETQMARFRAAYLQGVLRQDIAWFDTNNPQRLATTMSESMAHIESGLSSQTWVLVETLFRFLASIVLGLLREWSVALVAMAGGPFCIYALISMVKVIKTSSVAVSKAQNEAGGVALESLAAIRTVASLGMEEHFLRAYRGHLTEAARAAHASAWPHARNLAVLMSTGALIQGLTCVYTTLVIAAEAEATSAALRVPAHGADPLHVCTPGCSYDLASIAPPSVVACNSSEVPVQLTCGSAEVLQLQHNAALGNWSVLYERSGGHFPCELAATHAYSSTMIVSVAFLILGIGARPAQYVMQAVLALRRVVDVINRRPVIDSFSSEGKEKEELLGTIDVREVRFAYPSAPDRLILRGCTLHIEAGHVCALVGPSGSGKSTIIQLLERFYDPSSGSVMLDGVDVRELNLRWLRSRLGLVGQEPVLFMGTVSENIAYGKPGASEEEVEAAARMANAHTFITESLGAGYATQVGLGGGKLSGGQKQRVAIARALVRKPAVLLLDEATSALDNESERIVQAALDQVVTALKRTTITIAHRLSTIRDADKIVVLSDGVVVEEGSYDSLLVLGGAFSVLAQRQESARAADAKLVRLKQLGSPDTSLSLQTATEMPLLDATQGRQKPEGVRVSSDAISCTHDVVAIKADIWEVKAQVMESAVVMRAMKPSTSPSTSGPTAWQAIRRIAAIQLDNPKDRWLVFTGLLCSVGVGALTPVTQLVYVRLIVVLLFKYDPLVIRDEGLGYAGGLIGCALATMVLTAVELACFKQAAEHATLKLRCNAFRALITKDIGFFDHDRNSAGDLAEFLASKVAVAEAFFGESLDLIAKAISTIAVSIAIIYIWGQWQLSLVAFALLPILSLSAMSRTKSSGAQRNSKAMSEVASGQARSETFEKIGKDDSKTAGAIIGEVVLGVRTVVSFNTQQHFLEAYSRRVLLVAKKARAGHVVSAVSMAFLEGTTPPMVALMVWYGTWLASVGAMGDVATSAGTGSSCSGGLSSGMEIIERIMVPMMVTFYASAYIGSTLGNMTDGTEANQAAQLLWNRLDAVVERHPLSESGLIPSVTNGTIDVREVRFAYPSAPDRLILRGCTLHIEAGHVCALVGPSGSGKSTIIQLLERFYDPSSGSVMLDGVDVRELNLRWLRSRLGLVGQEPVLFMGTVSENIAYGKPGASEEEVEAAARMANAHTFITESLGAGYATQVGLGGGKLSGGQKQRVAIARALVRKPAVLLLDEATSALDNESERIVQAALDQVVTALKRTTITIAHRLSTIRDADKIVVLSDGVVVEEGTHSDLLAQEAGVYHHLVLAHA